MSRAIHAPCGMRECGEEYVSQAVSGGPSSQWWPKQSVGAQAVSGGPSSQWGPKQSVVAQAVSGGPSSQWGPKQSLGDLVNSQLKHWLEELKQELTDKIMRGNGR
nr:hypothetical protein BgiMline_002606 [Biomphalaria glabrata]